MKPVTRWSLVGLAVVVIAILFMLWSQRDKQPAPADSGVAQQPVAPMPSKADEPVTASVHFDFDRSVLRAGETSTALSACAGIGRSFFAWVRVWSRQGHSGSVCGRPTLGTQTSSARVSMTTSVL